MSDIDTADASTVVESPQINFPEWTEFSEKNGLDPLGMQNSSVDLYQTFLPGISNVTLRMRYYGLYAWLCRNYAREVGDTNPDCQFASNRDPLFAANRDPSGTA